MVGRDEGRSVGQDTGDRMNVRLPHLSRTTWIVLIVVLVLVLLLLLTGVIGGHGGGGS